MKEEAYTIERTPLNAPMLSDLKEKKVILPETPCDHCGNKQEECRMKEMACSDLVHYINKGIIRSEDRFPDRDNFLKINPHLKDMFITSTDGDVPSKEWTTLQKELKLLNKLRIVSLQEIEKYFENKTTLEKVKIACITYGLVLKADSFSE